MSNIKINGTGMAQERIRMILPCSRTLRPWCEISSSIARERRAYFRLFLQICISEEIKDNILMVQDMI